MVVSRSVPAMKAREARMPISGRWTGPISETPSLVSRDAVREEAGVDAEPRSDPLDRLARRARLAALDLGDVLLREALARELALRKAGGHPKLPQPLAQAEATGGPTVRGSAAGVCEGGVSGHSGKVK